MSAFQVTYEIKDTVANQLRELFATPKGSLILEPDYGIDFSIIDTDIGYALDATNLKILIKDQIVRYIPRLNAEKARIVVKYHPGTGQLAVTVNDIFINIAGGIGAIDTKRL